MSDVDLPPFEGQVKRRLCDVVCRLLQEEPVTAIHGARSVGKSTILEQVTMEWSSGSR